MAFQMALVVKKLPVSARDIRDMGPIPGFGRSLGIGNGNPFQYSCLKNPMGGGAWQAILHGVTRVGYNLATKERESDLFCIVLLCILSISS